MRRVTLPSAQDPRRRGSAGSAMTTTSPTRGVRGMEDRDDIDFAASSRSAGKYSRSHVDQTAEVMLNRGPLGTEAGGSGGGRSRHEERVVCIDVVEGQSNVAAAG